MNTNQICLVCPRKPSSSDDEPCPNGRNGVNAWKSGYEDGALGRFYNAGWNQRCYNFGYQRGETERLRTLPKAADLFPETDAKRPPSVFPSVSEAILARSDRDYEREETPSSGRLAFYASQDELARRMNDGF